MIGHNDKNNVSNLRYSQPSPVVDMLVDCMEYQISACQLTRHEQPRPGSYILSEYLDNVCQVHSEQLIVFPLLNQV